MSILYWLYMLFTALCALLFEKAADGNKSKFIDIVEQVTSKDVARFRINAFIQNKMLNKSL